MNEFNCIACGRVFYTRDVVVKDCPVCNKNIDSSDSVQGIHGRVS